MQFFEALQDMMKNADISPKTQLADLQGEVFIENGTPWVSRIDRDDETEVVVECDPSVEAPLFFGLRHSPQASLGKRFDAKKPALCAGFSLVRRDRDSNPGDGCPSTD